MAGHDDLAWLSAGELARAIAAGQVTAVEATTAALARVGRINPRLNAFASVDAEGALASAEAADAARACGQPLGPLAGVPLAHKDMFDLVGQSPGCGARIKPDHPPRCDATVMRRLATAGALTLGKLHMAEFAFGITGHNYHLGHCRNPWQTDHIPGGSSSGPAAAVASGLVPLALGSDTAGSLRVPAACCGLVSLRPTWGRVGRGGAMPLSFSLDAVGPLARTVEDLALALSIIAGPEPDDPTAAEVPVPAFAEALGRGAGGRRIGVDESLLAATDGALHGLFANAIQAFVDCGAEVVPISVPDLDSLDRWSLIVQSAEASAVHAKWMHDRPNDYSDQVRARLEHGFAIAAVDYLQAQRQRPLALAAALDGMLGRADAVLMPVLGGVVPTLAETDVAGGPAMAAMLGAMLRYTRPISYLGLPTITLPMGFSADGLPNGFQLIGRPYAEAALLAAGAAYVAARQPLEGRRPAVCSA